MAAYTPSRSKITASPRPPPTGPKALRANGTPSGSITGQFGSTDKDDGYGSSSTGGLLARSEKISFAFPSAPPSSSVASSSKIPHGPRASLGNDRNGTHGGFTALSRSSTSSSRYREASPHAESSSRRSYTSSTSHRDRHDYSTDRHDRRASSSRRSYSRSPSPSRGESSRAGRSSRWDSSDRSVRDEPPHKSMRSSIVDDESTSRRQKSRSARDEPPHRSIRSAPVDDDPTPRRQSSRQSRSPVKTNGTRSPTKPKERSPVKSSRFDEEMKEYKSTHTLSADDKRAKISIAIPILPTMTNGKPRPRPPHEDLGLGAALLSRIGSKPKPPHMEQRPPSPPPPSRTRKASPLPAHPPSSQLYKSYPSEPVRPGSPPPRDSGPPPDSPPPPPPDDLPTPPPISPPPNPPSSPPPSRLSTLPAISARDSPNKSLARPLPPHLDPNFAKDVTRSSPAPASRQTSPEILPRTEEGTVIKAPISAVPPSEQVKERLVTAPQPPPPPRCLKRRPGLGSFVTLHDPAVHGQKGGKEIRKRYDGMDGDKEVELKDPRLATGSRWREGRGGSKQRSTFYQLDYEWDKNSAGSKPPPPAPAVLITGLNPLTTVDQISKHLRPHGKIREIDSKMDTKSGMQLGICWVKFDGPNSGKPGTAHDVAVQVVKLCDGQRIGLAGNEKAKVVLDGRGLRAEKAVKEEMARRYPPKKPAPPPAPKATTTTTTTTTTTSTSGPAVSRTPALPARSTPIPTPNSAGAGTPRHDSSSSYKVGGNVPVPKAIPFHSSLPSRPRAPYNPTPVNYNGQHNGYSASGRVGPMAPLSQRVNGSLIRTSATSTQNLSASFIDAPFGQSGMRGRGRMPDRRDTYTPRRSRSRSRSHPRSCSTCSSYFSDSEDDRPSYRYRRRSPSPYAGRGRARIPSGPTAEERKQEEAAVERVKAALAENNNTYVHIDANVLPAKSVSEDHLKDHFRAFKPAKVLHNHQGWYILFSDDITAANAKILNNTLVQGHRLVINVRTPSARKAQNDGPLAEAPAEKQVAGNWKFLTFTKKNRPASTPKPKVVSPKVVKKVQRRALSYSSSESSDEDEVVRPVKGNKERIKSPSLTPEVEAAIPPPMEIETIVKTTTPVKLEVEVKTTEVVDEVDDTPVVKAGKKRANKGKSEAKKKKARITSPVLDVTVPAPAEPELAEIQLDEKVEATPVRPVKAAKPKKAPKTEAERFIENGIVVDEEDAYWLGQALAAAEGVEPEMSDDEEDFLLDEKHPLYHQSGSWRAEGVKKIPQTSKSEYLPQRNRAVVATEDNIALASGRTARVTGRRLAHDMESTRKTAAAATAESDLFAFNQLRIRKKQLQFARSPIEGYGLYAMETIQPGEMVCEYVGEICRSAVAEIREQRYLKQGIGSSYLFRIDADVVCDATFRGSVSRLINHSCDPSASAKIISINGQSKIVIYARKLLLPGQEILYDYKFPLESDPALRVPCLCGAPTCRGWLN